MSIRKTKEKGITLIALMVTIIVIIILAGITISAIKGNSGIISKADESKSQTERTEVIEKAKMTISNEIVGNGGNELTRSELKETLEKYFIEVPEDYTMDTELTTKSEYGNYKIKVSEIYDRDIMIASEEESDDNTTITPSTPSQSQTSLSTGGNSSSSNNSNSGSTSNNGNTTSGGSTGSSGTLVSENSTTEIDVTGIEIDRQTATIDINGENTIQLNSKLTPTNANKNTEVKWTSKKKAVASISKTGLVTGKTVGNSMIMATSQNGYSAECLVVCQAKITGITVNPTTARIPVGQTITLIATTSPKTLTEKVTWKSSNTDVAKVDRNGLVTGVAKGKAIITAQNPAGTIKATCTVTVGNATLMVASSGSHNDTDNYLRSNVVKNKIESIKFVKGQVPTSGIIKQFDASEAEDSSIIGYYTDEDSNDMYELTFVSETNIEANQNSSNLFYRLSKVKEIAFDNFDTSQVTNMYWMFSRCRSLTSLDVSKFDTSQVTNMHSMFWECKSLTSLDVSEFDTSQVTNMHNMFLECKSLTSLDVSKFDTSQVTNMGDIFGGCMSLTSLDVSKFDTSQVTSMAFMFSECSRLTSLDVSKFDTSQVTSMESMFSECSRLTNLDVSNFDTSRVTDMCFMFYDCSSLISLDVSKFNTSQVTNMYGMFKDCRCLTTIYVSEYNEETGKGWSTKNVTESSSMFSGATKLVGGNGTRFNSFCIDATYARIDKEGEPGYFTKSVKGTTFDKDEKIFISGEAVTIPGGMTVSSFKGEFESIDQGIVIYRLNGDVPDWTNKTKMQETYDQFVWVPVKNAILDLSSTYSGLDDAGIKSKVQEQINVGKYPMAIKTNTAGDYIGVLYGFSEVTENNTTYVKVIPNSKWTPKSITYREPAGLTHSEYGDTETNLKQINGILNTSYNSTTSFESALQSQYNEMVKKVEEKGGFWVGRYETSSMSNSTTENYIASNRIQVSSKRNTTNGINSVTWYRMYAQQKIYSELALESKTTSSMIWGSQYDQIMICMKEEKSSDQALSRGKYYVTNGAGKGNYGTISGVKNDVYSEIAPTGSQDAYSTKNIFDLAGNVWEWSLEAYGNHDRVRRGGSYYATDTSNTRPDYRYNGYPLFSNSGSGSRLTLY